MNDFEPKHSLLAAAAAAFDDTVAFRRRLHAHPELSFKETQTADYILARLREAGIACRRVAETGVLATVEGRGDLSRAVILRADIDALPLHEQSGAAWSSCNEGVMHACGHDMHAAALYGALRLLNDRRGELQGTVFGLFQPGEEVNPGGASLVLGEHLFEGYRIAACVGEHVDPELPTGTFGFRSGKYMASSDELYIKVVGVGGHGAMRANLKDPVLAAAELITALNGVMDINPQPEVPLVLSIGRVVADGATNVVPDCVEMEGTLRTFDEELRSRARAEIERRCREVAARHGVRAELYIDRGYPCVVNDAGLAQRVKGLAAELFGAEHTLELALRPTAEDFGYYTQVWPSLFFRCGVGGNGGGKLHTPRFNPDERALSLAPALLALTAWDILR